MSELTFSKDEHINYIIKNFDFKKVNLTMKLLNWQWAFKGIPSISELKKEARSLLNDVYDGDIGDYAACGGFRATRLYDSLDLAFIVSDYDSDGLNYTPEYEKLKLKKSRKVKLKKITDENY